MTALRDEPEGGRLGGVLLLAVGQLVSWGSLYYAFALFIEPLEREQGWSRTEVTGALTAGLLATAATSPLAGRLIDRFGGRLPMTGGSLAAALSLIARAGVERLLTFYLIWIGLGAAMAFVLYDAVFALLARTLVRSYRRAVTAITLVAGFASTVFLPLVHLFIQWLGWRGALVALAVLNLTVAGGVHFHVPPELDPPRRRAGPHATQAAVTVREAARGRAFWGILVTVVANATLFSAVTFHLVPMLGERGVPLATIVAAAALIGPAQVGARLLLLALEGRLSLRRSGLLAATLPVLGTAVLAAIGPGSPFLRLFPVLYGPGNGMLTIARATTLLGLLSRSSFGTINGTIALPVLAPVAAARLPSSSGECDGMLTALVGRPSAASRVSGGPRRAHLLHDRPGRAALSHPPRFPQADPIRSVTRQDRELPYRPITVHPWTLDGMSPTAPL